MESDEQLVEKARAGDAGAFGVLVERHQQAVAGFLISLLHDVDSAEEASQQAFLKAFKSLGGFRGDASFRTWVSRIALNTARSELRKARFKRWLPMAWGDAEEGNGNWEEKLRQTLQDSGEKEKLEKRLELEGAMKTLGPREKEFVSMRLEGYKLSEIAGVLEISEGTVKSTLFEAVRKLKKRLL